MKMLQAFGLALLLTLTTTFMASTAFAHCQIPCGIYDDNARVMAMLEDVTTIEKSMKLMAELAGKTDVQSQNQMVRWVMNKEEHSQKIISSISDYFLTQRVKTSQEDYAERLAKHHAVIVAAMKTKQQSDMKYAAILRDAVESLTPYYHSHK